MNLDNTDLETPQDKQKSFIRRIVPWLVLILILVLLFHRYSLTLSEVWETAKDINYPLLVSLSFIFVLGVLLFDTLSQWPAFNWFNCKVGFREIVIGRGAMMLLASLAYIFGQAGMAYYINRKKNVPLKQATGTVLYLFFLEFYGMILVSTVGILIIWPDLAIGEIIRNLKFKTEGIENFFISLASPGMVLACFVAVWVLFFAALRVFGLKKENVLARWLKGSGFWGAFQQATILKSLWLLFIKGLLCLHQMVMTIVIFIACGIDVPWQAVLAYMPISILISAVPITPMRFGTTQWAWVIFFSHHVPEATLITFSLVWQTILNIVRMLIGAAFFPAVRKDLF